MKTIVKIVVATILISTLIFIVSKQEEKSPKKDCGITIGREMLDEDCVYRGNFDLPSNWIKNDENLRLNLDDQATSLNRL